ncbi:hypothetical protein J3R82DRAFT_5066 [Butyriboletus roseoflavus]|nr:hypothetical protein J3R82DRAFT_5066 [Butyriboletus roseoflavus]
MEKVAAPAHNGRRPSLSISLSRSHSIIHSSNTGMDEFLLISPTSTESRSHGVRTVLSPHSPQPNVSTDLGSSPGLWPPDATFPRVSSTPGEHHFRPGSDTPRDADVRLPVPTFKAFPSLSPTSHIRPTRISAIGCLLAAVIVLTAIVYDIVQDVRGGSGG